MTEGDPRSPPQSSSSYPRSRGCGRRGAADPLPRLVVGGEVGADLLPAPAPVCGAVHVVAPMTTGGHVYPFRIECRFQDRTRHVVADQLRTVDRIRMVRRLGQLPDETMETVLNVLQRMFAA
ncbi:MAG: type II toxin-antitoxin system PemK/MazF family toxin [Gemmatimonadetes bacterium]|nr:type II toxin-antitoxin system PemK/MazF family toxin [Gemmatimonadota bacterium]MYJ40698.1 type II toxin-antitoxin system PemK/MazF family toxin [Gemmatimonadota bacterium]